jgi:hypothetical protein
MFLIEFYKWMQKKSFLLFFHYFNCLRDMNYSWFESTLAEDKFYVSIYREFSGQENLTLFSGHIFLGNQNFAGDETCSVIVGVVYRSLIYVRYSGILGPR